ncbi:hypothetical protein MAPG_02406 [Magnaporthiopsis poae ATCC 64411]|uniref:Uncharacterized protein n=1 Tax=Magnaporthiopsis poae (strain ATCC 64411 / 73-15) TaxID=644358 RepID=A0A0C4DRA0_MAGP6|nr:hypothetical protein MAPG_02406 [Magnaporthiopsis poae ATCC 64411]
MEQQRRQSRPESVHVQGDGESLLPPGDEDGLTSENDPVSLDRRVVGREEEMRAVTAVRLEKMESKEWKMTWRGNVLKVREQVTGIINVVQRFSGLVGQAASASPEAGLAFSGVCIILELIVADTKEREVAIEGLQNVTHIVARTSILERDYVNDRLKSKEDPESNENFEKALVSLYRAIAFYYMKAACYFARSTPMRTVRGLVAADSWESTLDSIWQADSVLSKLGERLGLSRSLHDLDAVLANLAKKDSKELVRDIAEWLDVKALHGDTSPELPSGRESVGGWLFEDPSYREWEDGGGRQLWIKGTLGTGKSTLVALVLDRMLRQRMQRDVAYFYCSTNPTGSGGGEARRGALDKAEAARILRVILGQLSMSPDRSQVVEEVEEAFEKSTQSGAIGHVPLGLEDAKELLVKVVNSRQVTTIIIDGLNGLLDHYTLLRAIRDVNEMAEPQKLRLLFSSQEIVHLTDFFSSAKTIVTGGDNSLGDMEAFIQARVDAFVKDRPGTLSEDISNNIASVLSKKAEGMFIWAGLCLDKVLNIDNTANQIADEWEKIKGQTFRGPLQDLVQIYDQAYNRTLGVNERERCVADQAAQRVFMWVLSSRGGLQSKQYFALHEGEAGNAPAAKTLRACQNFFKVSESGAITVSHSSVWAYVCLKLAGQVEQFIRPDATSSPKQNEDLLSKSGLAARRIAEERLARECFGMLPWSNRTLGTEEQDPTRPVSKGQTAIFLDYACMHGFDHLFSLGDDNGSLVGLKDLAFSLFDPENTDALRRWVDIYDREDLAAVSQDRASTVGRSKRPDPLYYAIRVAMATQIGDAPAFQPFDLVRSVLNRTDPVSWTGGPAGKPAQLACYLYRPKRDDLGDESLLKEILNSVDINDADEMLGTPLHAAISRRHLPVRKMLLAGYRCDVNVPSKLFGNVVHMALARGAPAFIESLVADHGADFSPSRAQVGLWVRVWEKMRPKLDDLPLLNVERILKKEGLATPIARPRWLVLDRPLAVLQMCVAYNRHATVHFPRAGAAMPPGSALTVAPGDGKSGTRGEYTRTTGLEDGGFVPLNLTWILLNTLAPRFQDIGSQISDIVCHHEKFVQRHRVGDNEIDLSETLSDVFAHAVITLVEIHSQMSSRFHKKPNVALQSYLESFSSPRSLFDSRMSQLHKMHKQASELEERATATTETARLLSDAHEPILSAIDAMRREMRETREQVAQLAATVQTLLDLQQKAAEPGT